MMVGSFAFLFFLWVNHVDIVMSNNGPLHSNEQAKQDRRTIVVTPDKSTRARHPVPEKTPPRPLSPSTPIAERMRR
jgi:hypothetical protein